MWAEQVGIGEIGLSPDAFWSLLVREFWIKHRAFERAEDRARSLVIQLAAMTGHYNEKDRGRLERQANLLRRYPVKRWLLPK